MLRHRARRSTAARVDSHSGILAYLQTEAGFASHASSMPQRQRHLRRAAAAAVIATTALAWAPARLKPVAPTRRSAATLQTPVAQATDRPISTEWELDCFSRPVVQDGKKLWELLVVDSTGQWREAVQLPATGVNSVAVREAVEGVIARAPVKPTVIRFFRRQMLNMLTIALGGVAAERPTLRVAPSRATHAIYDWLEERERDVYPNMEGYAGAQQVQRDRMTAPTTPARLPEALRGEQYAFVTLPVAEVQAGGGVTQDNVGVGKMINVKESLDPGAMLPGVAILTRRADALAMSPAVRKATFRGGAYRRGPPHWLIFTQVPRLDRARKRPRGLDTAPACPRCGTGRVVSGRSARRQPARRYRCGECADGIQKVRIADAAIDFTPRTGRGGGFREGESGFGRPALRRGAAARRRRRRARGLLAAAGDGYGINI